MQQLIQDIESRYKVFHTEVRRNNLCFITVAKEQAISVVTHLRDYKGYSVLTLLTAVDWIEEGNFQLIYLLQNPTTHTEIGVRTMIKRENATMESAHHLWEGIKTYQRELKEMFGINFPGSPGVDDDFILEGWDNMPPYRRDFDTKKYSEETYFPRPGRETNDPATYMKSKLYPND